MSVLLQMAQRLVMVIDTTTKGLLHLVPSSPIYRDVFMENEGTSFIANEDVFYNDTTEKIYPH